MKTTLTANREIDILNSDELGSVLRAELRSWSAELTRGAKFLRRSFNGTVNAAGDLTIQPRDDAGPAEGFVWAITRVIPLGLQSGESVDLCANGTGASDTLLNVAGQVFPGDHAVVLNGGDRLLIVGQSMTVGAQITVNLQVKETPYLTAWSL